MAPSCQVAVQASAPRFAFNSLASPRVVWTGRRDDFQRPRKCQGGCRAGLATLGLAVAVPRRLGRVSRSPVISRVASSEEGLVDDFEQISDAELRYLFEQTCDGSDKASFDQAIQLEGVEGTLDEGATSLKELEQLWGDSSIKLDLEAFSEWYRSILNIYSDFLLKDAVTLPRELVEDGAQGGKPAAQKKKLEDYTDDELLEDLPSFMELPRPPQEEEGRFGLQPVPEPEKSAGGRSMDEIKELFRGSCDVDNQLALDGFVEIKEIRELLRSGDLSLEELKSMWAELPKSSKGTDNIDVFTFKTLMNRIDDLFEDGDDEAANSAVSQEKALRSAVKVRQDLFTEIDTICSGLKENVGIDAKSEEDEIVVKLANELHSIWQGEILQDAQLFDSNSLVGDWELIYTTAAKFRRFKSILNAIEVFRDVRFETMIQSFSRFSDPDGMLETLDYDLEEVFVPPPGKKFDNDIKEVAIRASGRWKVSTITNVVAAEEEVKLQLNFSTFENDTMQGGVAIPTDTIDDTTSMRSFSYSFISYVDSEMLITRTGFSGTSVYVFRRFRDEEEEK